MADSGLRLSRCGLHCHARRRVRGLPPLGGSFAPVPPTPTGDRCKLTSQNNDAPACCTQPGPLGHEHGLLRQNFRPV
eukprot:1155244-Pelagomonas_calceolata.AAC.1